MFKVIAKRRKTNEIEYIGGSYNEIAVARVALAAFKSGAGSKFIHKYFTFIKIAQLG